MAEGLMISRDDIVKYTVLNGSVDQDKFIQFIKIAQDLHIKEYLGTDLFNKIQDDIEASSLTGNYLTLTNTYIKPMLIHFAMVEYLGFAAYTIGNKGIYKHSAETSETVSKEEVDALIERERSIAETYAQRFIDYMCFNSATYPEYTSNTNDDINPNRDNFFAGWVM